MSLHRFTLTATLAAAALLAGCGGGDAEVFEACPAPSAAVALPIVVAPGVRPVVYGTGAPWFTGPLQAAPADVSAAAGQPLWVCP